MSERDREPVWVADSGVPWRITLTAALPDPPDVVGLTAAVRALEAAQGWREPGAVDSAGRIDDLRAELAARPGRALLVGVAGRDLVVSAHHSLVDGQGLLAVLAALIGSDVTSAARGVEDRTTASGLGRAVADRLVEVGLRPPARVPGSGGARDAGDVFAELVVPGHHGTAELVVAAVAALGRSRHTAVAVGVARGPRDPEDALVIRDRSALIRLRDVERLSLAEVRDRLRHDPVQPAPGGTGSVLMRTGLRLLAPRLGSTLLVSHLGRVTADGVERLAFHPVTAGGSGLSLGAVGRGGDTTVTLRARRRQWNADGLEHLLEAVGAELTAAG